MSLAERTFGVWLRELRVGTLAQRGDHTRFRFADDYLADPHRPVLGLWFEQDLAGSPSAALRLPEWFSNLLPEGRLREWVAAERGVSPQREMELLAQTGHDLPGAVRVRPVDDSDVTDEPWDEPGSTTLDRMASDSPWRFSLAGVALKFSMLAVQDRLTLPATGRGGDWIVKLPDRVYPNVPGNEFAMMTLAGRAGMDVPEVRLVHRDEVDGLPPGVWPDHEQWAYAVKRFDRAPDRTLVHIEDLAQVKNVYADDKYAGNYETVGALLYRGHDVDSLREFARRLVFCVLTSNGDAHLKNWSLIYDDPRIPRISPAYDLVSTRWYMGEDEELGLRFGGNKSFERFRLSTFNRLERRLGADAGLSQAAREVVDRVAERWPEVRSRMDAPRGLMDDVTAGISARSVSMLSSA